MATATSSSSDPMLSPPGLSDSEAAAALNTHGCNELPSSKPRSFLRIILEVIREPMLLLLLACGGTYLLLGNSQEAIILLIFVFVVIAITLYQERKTERALEAFAIYQVHEHWSFEVHSAKKSPVAMSSLATS